MSDTATANRVTFSVANEESLCKSSRDSIVHSASNYILTRYFSYHDCLCVLRWFESIYVRSGRESQSLQSGVLTMKMDIEHIQVLDKSSGGVRARVASHRGVRSLFVLFHLYKLLHMFGHLFHKHASFHYGLACCVFSYTLIGCVGVVNIYF